MVKKNTSDAIDKDLTWITDFQGINNRQDMDKIPDNSSPLLINISLDKPGTWSKRKGSALLGVTQAGVGTKGLIAYKKSDNTFKLHAVRSTDLDEYDEALDSWAGISAAGFTAGIKVESVNYKQRVYHISTSDYLAWESGGALTTVSSGTNRIRGNSIATIQNTLFVGGSPDLGTDRVYFSDPVIALEANTPTDQFWSTADGSLPNSQDYFTCNAPVKGLFGYSQILLAFTADKCFGFDVRNYSTSTSALFEVFPIGLANPRAICTCNGFLIWMSPDKRIWAWGGSGVPYDVSWDIEDDENGEAIMNSILDVNIADVCAGSVGNKFYFSIGDITHIGVSVPKAVLCGMFNQAANRVLWSLRKYPVKPVIFANMTISNKKVLVFGADAVDDVYLMDVGTNDNGTAIDSSAKTKFFEFGITFATKDCEQLLIKYRPQVGATTYLSVKYALDGKFVYSDISTPDSLTPVTKFGVINMYKADYATNLDSVLAVNMPPGVNFRTLSLELANAQTGESFAISALGFKFSRRPLDKRIKST